MTNDCLHPAIPAIPAMPDMRSALRRALGMVALLASTLLSQPLRAWDAAAMQTAALRLGPQAAQAVAPLQALLLSMSAMDDTARLHAVNRFFNQRIRFDTDLAVWGEEDYWASPLEALQQGRGDCEDFAIAKYASLLAAGVAPAHLRLVYVRARLDAPGRPATSQPHMVLAYQPRPGDDPLILDNLKPDVLTATQRPDLSPVFSFGTEGLWHGNDTVSAGDPLRRLSRWRAVWAKLHDEGFV